MACDETALVHASVVYLSPARQIVLPVTVPAGASLREAVAASGLLVQAPELAAGLLAHSDHPVLDLGVFNRRCSGSEAVREGDRIEMYRPLAIDPKEARRVRVEVRRRRKAAQVAADDVD